MKILKKIKRWINSLFKRNKKHFFENPPTQANKDYYMPYLPMSDYYKKIYKSKISKNSKIH